MAKCTPAVTTAIRRRCWVRAVSEPVLQAALDQFWVGEQTFRAGPGSFAFGPRGITHTFRCLGPGPGKIQVIISPPGFEVFFVEVDELVRQGRPDLDQIVAQARKYGVEVFGPPPG
jgi:hypothetical protein